MRTFETHGSKSLIESVDSLAMVQRMNSRPDPDELLRRGFRSRPGTIQGTVTWFHNGYRPKYPPRLSFYEIWRGGYGLRADLSLPKFVHGNNTALLTTDEIYAALESVSQQITSIVGVEFDAFEASTCRIDYATNFMTVRKNGDAFFDRYQRFWIPRLKFRPDLSHSRCLYHGNDSRMIRIYDKLRQECGCDEISEPNSPMDASLVRLEYMLSTEQSVVGFAKRLGFPDTKIQTVLSPDARKAAVNEMQRLLKLETFNPEADFSFSYFLKQTRNICKARRLSSFVAAFETLGEYFNRQPTARLSDASYLRQLRECQNYGF